MSTFDTQPTTAPADPHLPPPPQIEPQTQHTTRGKRLFRALGVAQMARLALGVLLALLLVITWIGSSPNRLDAGSPADAGGDLTAAEIIYDSNNERAEGAPQQAVVNGWYANDVAVIQASQTSYLSASSARNGGLLLLIGLGVAGELIIRGIEQKGATKTKRDAHPTGEMNT